MMKERIKTSRPQSAKPASFTHLLKISERKKNPNDPIGNPVFLHRRTSKNKSSLNSFAAQLIFNEQQKMNDEIRLEQKIKARETKQLQMKMQANMKKSMQKMMR